MTLSGGGAASVGVGVLWAMRFQIVGLLGLAFRLQANHTSGMTKGSFFGCVFLWGVYDMIVFVGPGLRRDDALPPWGAALGVRS